MIRVFLVVINDDGKQPEKPIFRFVDVDLALSALERKQSVDSNIIIRK